MIYSMVGPVLFEYFFFSKRMILKDAFYTLIDIDSFIVHHNKLHKKIISDLWIQCHVCKTYFPSEKTLKFHCEQEHHVSAEVEIPCKPKVMLITNCQVMLQNAFSSLKQIFFLEDTFLWDMRQRIQDSHTLQPTF